MESLNERIINFLKVSHEDVKAPLYGDNGDGYGKGYGLGKACGCGHYSGACICDNGNTGFSKLGIKQIGNKIVLNIDELPTIIESVKGNIAKGFVVRADMSLQPCYIAKVGNVFAHGEDSHTAYQDAYSKALQSECVECTVDYVNYVVNKYPDVDALISNKELFELHNIITGSCTTGRNAFINDRNIDMEDKTSMRDFLKLVMYSYGSEKVQDIIKKYGITIE